ncbi:MAG: HlyD family efflux transporter periplasmic adaptor subunit [Saprospiraceae bacterium]
MDKDISTEVQKKQKSSIVLYTILAIFIIGGSIYFLRNSLKSSIKRDEIRIAEVELGLVQNTLTASGEVIPEFEQVITSPINAAIQNVYLDAGSVVKGREKIMELDKTFTQLEVEKQQDQLAQKKNGLEKQRWELEKIYFDLVINDSIKFLKINNLKAELENAKRLYNAGGGTKESIEQADMNLRVAILEKKQLENDIKVKQQTMKTDIRDLELSSNIQANDLKQLETKLQKANIVANRAGVLTYVNKNLGSKVMEGEVLARLADLNSFKVNGSISDTYAEKIEIGMSVIVKINDSSITGTITNIQPAVQNNILNFDVQLDEKGNKLLRPKLKVEVFIVTESHNNVLRVANTSAFKGTPIQDIYIVRTDGKAERRTIKVGLSNFDYVEILDGVKAGDRVILSDLSVFKNSTILEIE